MLTLIIASTMLSGVLVGLQSKKIDYDAVAYRTGVILVEDPGEPNADPYKVFINSNQSELNQWEFIGLVHKDQVLRFGLSEYKSSPKIISPQKIETFFDSTIYPDLSDYRERIIFGDYPYNFNITFKTTPDGPIKHIGDPYPENAPYGYIRRVVQVKNPSTSNVDMSYYELDTGSGQFDVYINFSQLKNYTRGSQYWVDKLDKLSLNLTNIPAIKADGSPNVYLKSMRMQYFYPVYGWQNFNKTVYFNNSGYLNSSGDNLNQIVPSYLSMEFPPEFFNIPIPISEPSWRIRFQFDETTANVTGIAPYQGLETLPLAIDYNPPTLVPAVMEVRVW
ncbi:MAG: hypothetical protein KO464_10385 [Candidatus Methanofastidiosum sp.]|nr:hypothetical protein [Methanofastidiosum sp.]